MEENRTDVIVLTGYLKLIENPLLSAFQGRILNVHPALLPAFGGPGMYGKHVHDAVLKSGQRWSGATVHLVDGQFDTGPLVAQRRVHVSPHDSVASLERRVTDEEKGLLVDVINDIARWYDAKNHESFSKGRSSAAISAL